MTFLDVGSSTRDYVLKIAGLVKESYVPGLVVLILLGILTVGLISLLWQMTRRHHAISELLRRIASTPESEFAKTREQVSAWLDELNDTHDRRALREAWNEFNETVFVDVSTDVPTLRNAARPSAFFNIDDLHFGPGFLRILPSILVSLGLALTFLGLIAALNEMSGTKIDEKAMAGLLSIASAKFIMSLTGLGCSIIFTIMLRLQTGRVESVLHALCRALEKRLTFVSLEQIAQQQLAAIIESRDYQRLLGYELVAELSKPISLLPGAISTTITEAIGPILVKIQEKGDKSLGDAADKLAEQLTASVAGALTLASDKLGLAADRIGQLVDRMSRTSGEMGAGMDQAVARLAQVVDELREAMLISVNSTGAELTKGAEQLLSAMNTTLQGIRDNTEQGAQAMSAAATQIHDAIMAMRKEIYANLKVEETKAKEQIEGQAKKTGEDITETGTIISKSFEKTAAEIALLAEDLSKKMGRDLIQPLSALSEQLQTITGAIKTGTTDMQSMSQGVRAGGEASLAAATNFRSASQSLIEAAAPVRATTEQLQSSVRSLSESMGLAARTVSTSAERTENSAASALSAAQAMLGDQHKGITAVLDQIGNMLGKLQDQIKRVDGIDQTFGLALRTYTTQTENQMTSIRNHVQQMSDGLGTALSSMYALLDALKDFTPEQKGR